VPYCLCPTRMTPLFGLALVITGCGVVQVKDADPEAVAALNGVRYPSPDAQLGEHLYPDEKTIADKLSVVIEESLRKQYSTGTARRDAHPKAHGCVKAEIRIVDTLPATLSKGMFVPGKNVPGMDSLLKRLR
jgi:hypothetical protein